MPNMKNGYTDIDKYKQTRNAQRKRYYKKTANYEKRSWTEEENKRVLDHNISDTELSSEIKRSVQSIQIQRSRLKKKK